MTINPSTRIILKYTRITTALAVFVYGGILVATTQYMSDYRTASREIEDTHAHIAQKEETFLLRGIGDDVMGTSLGYIEPADIAYLGDRDSHVAYVQR